MDKFTPNDGKTAQTIAAEDTRRRQLELEAGLFGKIFGSSANTPIHIAGFVVIVLVLAGLIYTFISDEKKSLSTAELWKILIPVISTALAYIFGASSRRSK